jgi:O-antigen ligase
MLGIAIIAGIELLTGRNLLPWVGAVQEWVETSDARIMRVDGPFENSSVLSLVGALGFLLLLYLRRLIPKPLTNSRRALHIFGVLAAFGSVLMPMNRGLVIALLVCAIIDYFSRTRLISRRAWTGLFALILLVIGIGKLLYPEIYEDRITRGDNLYQRIAQHQQTFEVIRDHPFTGVGYNLYRDAVEGNSRYEVRWKGFTAMNVPHSSLMAVLADEGFIGFVFYVGAQAFFLRAMWRVRMVNRLGWQLFLYFVLLYTIFGLDVGISYYSDLNIFYMFVLGITLQIQLQMASGEGSPDDHYRV